MTPEQHVTVAIILGGLVTILHGACLWLRWDDWRGMR